MMSKKGPKSGVIQAAGGLVWRETTQGEELAVIYRERYGDWSLPKGKLEKGETWQETALREVQEETNCTVRLGDFAGCSCYTVDGVPKVVLFWHMMVTGECRFTPNDEIDRLTWLPLEAALEKLSYDEERALLK